VPEERKVKNSMEMSIEGRIGGDQPRIQWGITIGIIC
jgi:hypothetical protein